MATMQRQEASLRPPGHSEARAAGALLIGAAAFVAFSLALPHPGGGNTDAIVATGAAMGLAGLACFFSAPRIGLPVTHFVIAATVGATALLIYESGIAIGQYGSIFVWATLVCGYYFKRRVAIAHLAWTLSAYAVALAAVESTAGYSPVTRWLFTAVSLTVVMLIVNIAVAHGDRADQRARRFFDLSHDMLCTMDTAGHCVETNAAWREQLGYTEADLFGRRLLDLTHPDDHDRAVEIAAELFRTGASEPLESRVRAKDGSWHWLRTSSAFASEDGLVYARSTDVTELKRVEREREELLGEVQMLARSDPLTGLPNRRGLSEAAPREMARARRSGKPLCLAIIDIDHFKAYNDSNGHLEGDAVLRESAIAWDSQMRAEDTILRFGGEEFLVLLPETAPGEAVEIVERLRAATPRRQTCSAGLACWDFAESLDDLVERADLALYRAKADGRDRLVAAADSES
jgi:diguanylate cyclase (GGDEF)-like protein/PAS domain S-box-containing protein